MEIKSWLDKHRPKQLSYVGYPRLYQIRRDYRLASGEIKVVMVGLVEELCMLTYIHIWDHYNWSQTVNIVTWTSAGHLLPALSHHKISQQNIALLLGQVHTAEHKVVFFLNVLFRSQYLILGCHSDKSFIATFSMAGFRIVQFCVTYNWKFIGKSSI